jgi:hypothetical protein
VSNPSPVNASHPWRIRWFVDGVGVTRLCTEAARLVPINPRLQLPADVVVVGDPRSPGPVRSFPEKATPPPANRVAAFESAFEAGNGQ